MNPVFPFSMISETDAQRHAITGVPQAMASISTRPNGSGQSIGNRRALAFPRKADYSLSPISPISAFENLPDRPRAREAAQQPAPVLRAAIDAAHVCAVGVDAVADPA